MHTIRLIKIYLNDRTVLLMEESYHYGNTSTKVGIGSNTVEHGIQYSVKLHF